jgi:hypothetical protein
VLEDGTQTTGFDETLDKWLASGPAGIAGYSKKSPPPQFIEILREANRLGREAFNPAKGFQGGPTEYGNDEQWRDALRKSIPEGQIDISGAQDTVYYYVDSWIVYSVSQYNYWKGEK